MTPLDEVKGDPEVDFGTISGVGVNCVGRHAWVAQVQTSVYVGCWGEERTKPRHLLIGAHL